MARIDGREAAQEAMLDIARLAVAAAYRAPQLTGRLELKTEIVTGNDIAPIVEVFEAVHPISPVMFFDYQTLKYYLDRGISIPIILLGADLTRAEMGWNCGACGFETCGKFNAYAKKHKSRSMLWGGPSCNWKVLDFGAACDFACAALAQYRIDARAMGTVGGAASTAGFLPDCSGVIGIPIGPPGDFKWFSRATNIDTADYDTHRHWMLRTSPTHWQTFPGSTKPSLKTKDDWWSNPEFVKWEPFSAEEQQFVNATLTKVMQVAQKVAPQVSAWYQQKEKK